MVFESGDNGLSPTGARELPGTDIGIGPGRVPRLCPSPKAKARDLVPSVPYELDEDEQATGTIEWVMLIIVALIVLAVIYYFVQWAIQGTADAAAEVEGEYGD